MIDRWKQLIHSFIFKSALFLVLIATIPFAAAMAVYSIQISSRAENELVRHAQQWHEQIVRQLHDRVQSLEKLTETLVADGEIQSYVFSAMANHAENESAVKDVMREKFRTHSDRTEHIAQICLLTVSAERSVCLYPEPDLSDTRSEADGEAGGGQGQNGQRENNRQAYRPFNLWDQNHEDFGVEYGVVLEHPGDHSMAGRIVSVMNISHLMDEMAGGRQGGRSFIGHLISDRLGNILYRKGTTSERTFDNLTEMAENEVRISPHSITSIRSFELGGTRWYSQLEIHNTLRQFSARALKHSLAGFFLLLLLLVAAGIFLFSRYVTQPLARLQQLMKRAERGDLKAYWVSDGTQEINDLGRSYNQMLNRLEDLIKQVKREETLKKEAEIAALQYQLNPHFLYNTLNTIKWVAKLHNTPQISEVINALVRLLQASLGKKGDFITLREEIGLVRDYMEIQRFRYGDKVELNVEIDPVAQRCLVPRMILQPLVENACIHGIEPGRGDGKITVRAWIDRDLLYCQVEDNGIGMKTGPTAGEISMKGGALKERMSGIGLRHIREKINLYYGEDYKMHIFSKEGQGTTVRLSLPIHHSEI